jgi:hypothetical protein
LDLIKTTLFKAEAKNLKKTEIVDDQLLANKTPPPLSPLFNNVRRVEKCLEE